jgi:hypothetical protein
MGNVQVIVSRRLNQPAKQIAVVFFGFLDAGFDNLNAAPLGV